MRLKVFLGASKTYIYIYKCCTDETRVKTTQPTNNIHNLLVELYFSLVIMRVHRSPLYGCLKQQSTDTKGVKERENLSLIRSSDANRWRLSSDWL